MSIDDALVERMAQLIRALHADHVKHGAIDIQQDFVVRTAAIVAELPEPVDPDWLEAGRIAVENHHERGDRPFSERHDDWTQSLLWQGIKRGRELESLRTAEGKR